MKYIFIASALLALLGCDNFGDASQGIDNQGDDQVRKFLESYRQTIEGRESTQLRAMYVSDGRFKWIEDGEIRYRSPDEIIAGLSTLPTDVQIRTEYDDVTISMVGADGALVSAEFQTTIGIDPDSYNFGGRVTMTLERSPSGWRIVGGHTSSRRLSRP